MSGSSSSDSPDRDPPRSQSEVLRSLIHQKRREKAMQGHVHPSPAGTSRETGIADPYEGAALSATIVRGRTGIVYDSLMLKHRCEWDTQHLECPRRLSSIIKRCVECELLSQCYEIPNNFREDFYERLAKTHSTEHFEQLRDISRMESFRPMELQAARYDSVYFNMSTFDVATYAASSALNLVVAVAQSNVMNGMAIIRPPGHHAMKEEFNGFCYFNNVGIAAETCIDLGLAKKILIVDVDVHHGQGTQRMFYERSDVLYFSVHRYEHGYFWPNLLESNFNYIGKGAGLGYNVNVPLNTTGMGDDEYLAIVFSILLPLGYEFNPDLIIVSAGYDAAFGCPEGKMLVTPGFYAHLISLLHPLANGKVAVVLEGGYCLQTLAEGAALTLKALLGGPTPRLDPVKKVHPAVEEVIRNVRRVLIQHWRCFSICEFITPSETIEDRNLLKIQYYGVPDVPPFPTRGCCPEYGSVDASYFVKLNEAYQEKYKEPVDHRVLYALDDVMLRHAPQIGEVERPERPERLTAIKRMFIEYGLDRRLSRIPIVNREFGEYNPHAPGYFDTVNSDMEQSNDLYVNEHTHDCVVTAVSALLDVVDGVVNDSGRSGIAVIRPPGHHAEHSKAQGFCFINNVAVAANYLLKKYDYRRILIVDFDVHHGNGTQNLFYTNPHVLYISIHRDENGKFFPSNSARGVTCDGFGAGKGYNVNIPFSKDKMGDTEYIAVFHSLILPIAYSYNPEIVLVSAGFDAGVNDPLGGYMVSPETFGHMILMLKNLAEGRLVLTLEGGYNLTTTGYGMTMCGKALLGDPITMPKDVYSNCSREAIKTIRTVMNHFKQYYPILDIKPLPNIPVILKKVENFTEDLYQEDLTRKVLDINRIDDNEYVEQEMEALNND